MLEYREVSPLPEYCLNCQEQECYNCDFTLYRWELINDNTKDLFRQMNERREARAIEREQQSESGITEKKPTSKKEIGIISKSERAQKEKEDGYSRPLFYLLCFQ